MKTPKMRLATLLLAVALGGCSSMQQFVVNKAGDALSGSSTVVAADDDPEFVRAAAPFSLKLTESLLAKSPEHGGLLLSAASGFTQYAYAFLQADAEELESDEFTRSEILRQRARRMYLRARDYGLRGLALSLPDVREALQDDPVAALQTATRKDAAFMYWIAASWAAAISQAKDDPGLVGDLPIVDAMVARAGALDADFGDGALHSLQISYEMARAARPEVAREHFRQAVRVSGGKLAAPYLALAESVCIGLRERAEFEELLRTALAIDPDADPYHRLENLIMQRRARWLQSRIDELFLGE